MQHSYHRFRIVMVVAIAVAVLQHAATAWAQPIVSPPAVSVCPDYTVVVTFAVEPPVPGGTSFQWQIETSPGVWSGLGNDPMPLPCGGGAFAYASQPFSSATPIGIHACADINTYQIRCVVTNDKGSLPSNAAMIKLCCSGDINCDDTVNAADLLEVINAWGACPEPCPSFCGADVTFDCVVNVADLLFVINHWG